MIDTFSPDTDLLTTEEVIEALLADPFLRRLAATCVLPAVHFGEEVRFRKRDLDAWIRKQRDAHLRPS